MNSALKKITSIPESPRIFFAPYLLRLNEFLNDFLRQRFGVPLPLIAEKEREGLPVHGIVVRKGVVHASRDWNMGANVLFSGSRLGQRPIQDLGKRTGHLGGTLARGVLLAFVGTLFPGHGVAEKESTHTATRSRLISRPRGLYSSQSV